jgi:low temperature requirement protein LtrA
LHATFLELFFDLAYIFAFAPAAGARALALGVVMSNVVSWCRAGRLPIAGKA